MTTQIANLPSYSELPVKPGAPQGSAWGLFGDDDQLGCLNLLTPERVVAGAKLVRKGAVFPLNLSIDQPNPPLFGRGAPRVEFVTGEVHRDDYLDNFWPQASSQWDSLRHILHPRDGFYNGVKANEIVVGGGKLGIENIARRGIAGRGVLLDVARHLEKSGAPLDYTTATVITKDVLPYSKTVSERNTQAYGPNVIGLERKGFTPRQIQDIKAAFRLLLQSKLNTTQAVQALKARPDSPETQIILNFIENSVRGVIK